MAPVRAGDCSESLELSATAACVVRTSVCPTLKRKAQQVAGAFTDLSAVRCKRLRASGGACLPRNEAGSPLAVTADYGCKPSSVLQLSPEVRSAEDRHESVTSASRVCAAGWTPLDVGTIVALDCEFVGIAGGISALGRCSIVDFDGVVLLDIYSRPDQPILDYRTPWSGITRRHMINALPFDVARRKIKSLIKNKIVVGHALHNDFRVLDIRHPRHLIRDTSTSPTLNRLAHIHKGPASLKRLSQALLSRRIQVGSHCSVEDARAAMSLYKLAMSDWEKSPAASAPHISLFTAEDDEESFLEDEYWPPDLSYDTR